MIAPLAAIQLSVAISLHLVRAGTPHPESSVDGVIWEVSTGPNGIANPYYPPGGGVPDPCSFMDYEGEGPEAESACGLKTGQAAVESLTKTLGAGENSWYVPPLPCSNRVQMFDNTGKRITFAEGPLVLGEQCAGCTGKPWIDVSSVVNQQLLAVNGKDDCHLQAQNFTIQVMENVIPGFTYVGTHEPVNPATDAKAWLEKNGGGAGTQSMGNGNSAPAIAAVSKSAVSDTAKTPLSTSRLVTDPRATAAAAPTTSKVSWGRPDN
ncbi:uncharacterized protein I303_106660 [Kwoniella dejecticola CBS 10117]|uniref:Barwin domain-containing protein n=1 Tax=Kwoniella dejecticola CBS 10117 TaxID=1296121 RepID=A0A1A5ZU18_9TREE|nr:uncharacterized protein I303_08697 [Kwoniella dejecticola CBS 10117]OBR81311.1 hypothetical protein I303_08697 [Kwoniella dejecticola CBS 10117]